jgi:hypothetical protein
MWMFEPADLVIITSTIWQQTALALFLVTSALVCQNQYLPSSELRVYRDSKRSGIALLLPIHGYSYRRGFFLIYRSALQKKTENQTIQEEYLNHHLKQCSVKY